ncbi:hypothetical protein NQ314_014607 [Rhamnusium bicolor]|uniref:Uncharacterized protein n=1 Tax=Rhamnusium bicolor TaxID=1586634 RepID=A0AAV8X0T9_9CUCU|nr:hypothetical protein NQ314_014607 [Rhamnusium bicolor]
MQLQRKCGLVPWNPDAVAFEKTSGKTNNAADVLPQNLLRGRKDAIETIEHFIGKKRLETFTSYAGILDGDIRDTSLYTVWKTMKSCKLPIVNSLGKENNSVNASLPQENGSDNIENEVSEVEAQNNKTPVKEDAGIIGTTLQDSETRAIIVHSTPLQTEKDPLQPVNFGQNSPLMLVPTPFKIVLFWPEEKENTSIVSRKKKEKVPSVITFKIWQEFNIKKKLEKEKKEKQ